MTDHRTGHLSPGAQKLARHLSQAGAFARRSSLDDAMVDLFRTCGSQPTLGAGTARADCVAELMGAGLACWNGSRLEAGAGLSSTFGAQVRDNPVPGRRSGPATDQVMVNRAESPLSWLAARCDSNGRPLLRASCVAAGEKLRADLERSAIMPRLGADWTRIPGANGGGGVRQEPGEVAIAARQRCEAALASVGPEMSGLLIDVCGFLKGLGLVEMERGWPPRSARVVLALALGRLADHYGFEDAAIGPVRPSRRNHVWRPETSIPDQLPRSG